MPIKVKIWNPQGKNMIHDVENVFSCLMQQHVNDKTQPTGHWTAPYDHTKDGMKFLLASGILDLNDDEVYAGDVVRCPKGRNDVVEFKNGSFWLKYRNCTLHHFMFTLGHYIEILGNIYKNPELVEV